MATFGNRPEDAVTDSRGNVQPGVVITVFASESDATLQRSPLGAQSARADGRWPIDIPGKTIVWAREPKGSVWPVGSDDVLPDHETRISTVESDLPSKLDTATAESTFAAVDAVAASATAAQIQASIDAASAHDGTAFLPPTVTEFDLGATGLTIPARTRLASLNPQGATLRYTGTGTAVTLADQRASLSNVRVLVDSASATAVGVKVDGTTKDNLYWGLDDVTISATAKVAGQQGFLLVNNAAHPIFYGRASGVVVENFAKGFRIDGDRTFGINSNTFDLKVHNADTAIDFGTGDGNMFSVRGDLYTLGLTGSGHRNQIHARLEGGGGDTAYTLDAASQENYLVLVAETGADTSTDAGTDNLITNLSVGAPKAWDSKPAWVAPFYPPLANADGTVPAGANNAQFVKLPAIGKAGAYQGARLEVTVQSGNIDVGLYELVGTNLVRRASVGGYACPGVGPTNPNFAAPYTVRADRDYYLAIAADNVTAKFKALGGVDTYMLDVTGPNVAGKLVYGSGAGGMYPLPATVAVGGLVDDAKVIALILR